MYRLLTSLILVLVPLSGACSNNLPDASLIESLRVLAVRADLPEVSPGQTVELDALVVGVDPSEVTYQWYACLVSQASTGGFGGGDSDGAGLNGVAAGVSTCEEIHARDPQKAMNLGTGATAKVTIPADFLSPENIAAAYGLPEGLPELVLVAFTSVAGVNMTIHLTVSAGEEVVKVTKHVNVSEAPDINANPEGSAFLLRAAPYEDEWPTTVDADPSGGCLAEAVSIDKGEFIVRPVNIPDPAPLYNALVSTTDPRLPFDLIERDEVQYYSFFASQGEFSSRQIKSTGDPSVSWTFEEEPTTPVSLWIVIRDGRGGVNWCHSVL
jgi:hypothetical protein